MNAEKLKQIEEIYYAALEIPPAGREAFFKEVCGADEHLRREVESLLAFEKNSGNFLDTPPESLAAEMFSAREKQTTSLINQEISHYNIKKLLGKGGMGEVYLAEDTELGRQVALKVLPAELTKNEAGLQRFEREAQAASSLNHPNILTVYEISAEDGLHFIATEFIDGESLRQHIGRTRLELREVLDIGIQIASALAAAHKAGVVHRDIKPENIMLRADGFVKVLDFGLAKLADETTAVQHKAADAEAPTRLLHTEPGVVMGTAPYMSPEQARGLKVDARTDVWSLGVVLYEMLTRRTPFAGETMNDVIAAILKTEAAPPTSFNAEITSELERIVLKTLRKDCDQRYQHSKDLLIDLKDLKHELEFEAKLERSSPPDTHSQRELRPTLVTDAVPTGGASDIHTTSSAEYLVNGIKQHKRRALLILATLLVATSAAYVAYSRYAVASDTASIDSIAILPFTNATGDPNTEYLSDGISESLINNLSQLPQLKVIARSSAFKYKGKEIDPQAVAGALGVDTILTGRVLQRGESLQITVELMDVRDNTQVWGANYDRRATDLLETQAEISGEIAEKLRLRLTTGEQQQLAKRETTNPAAYELMLRGRFYRDKAGRENRKKAVEYFQQATDADPNYALAHAELSRGYRGLTTSSLMDPKEGTPKAAAAARRSLELDESLPDAHYAMAYIRQDAWDWAGAEVSFKRAIELNPNYARAHQGYAYYLSVMGRHDQAINEAKRARELDPISPPMNTSLGWILHFARQYDLSLEALKKSLELDQNHPTTHLYIGYNYAAKGMHKEAIAAFEHVIKLGGDTPSVRLSLGAAYAGGGERGKAQAILKQLQTGENYASPYELATLYAAMGEREQAFAALEKGYAAHDLQLQYLGVDPSMDSLRSDPRFVDLLRRVGLQ